MAAQMNREFVAIKVDREERPDIDDVYMAAVQAMTGAGGWPMSVFLTPDWSHSSAAPTSAGGAPRTARRSGPCSTARPRRIAIDAAR